MSASHGVPRRCPICGTETVADHCARDGTRTLRQVAPDRDAMRYQAGELVSSRYRLLRAIGRGGHGVVYAAEHTGTRQPVALKILTLDTSAAGTEMVRRFFQEAQITARLRAMNTVRLFDVDQDEAGALFLVMELLEGPTLDQALRAASDRGEVLTEAQALDVAIPVLRSLHEAHGKGLVHRDLKPANIVLSAGEDGEILVKVLDFGIARTQDSSLTTGGKSLGTPTYMSPEQCEGTTVDGRSDLYSLGVILWRCVVGQPPFAHESPLGIMYMHRHAKLPDLRGLARTAVSDAFVDTVTRLLAKEPDARFADARSLRATLEILRNGAGFAPTPPLVVAVAADADEAATQRLDPPLPPRLEAAQPSPADPPSSERSPVRADEWPTSGLAPARPAGELTTWLASLDADRQDRDEHEEHDPPPPETPPDTPAPRSRSGGFVAAIAALLVLAWLGFRLLQGGGADDRPPLLSSQAVAHAGTVPLSARVAGSAPHGESVAAMAAAADAAAAPGAVDAGPTLAGQEQDVAGGLQRAGSVLQGPVSAPSHRRGGKSHAKDMRHTPGPAEIKVAPKPAVPEASAASEVKAVVRALDCASRRECATVGLCTARDGHCVATRDSDCYSSEACTKSGLCRNMDGRCIATRDADCEESEACARVGLCTAVGGRCIAQQGADCQPSEACTQRGFCSASNGRCLPVRDSDCRQSAACALRGECSAVNGVCVATKHTDCASSQGCIRNGLCTSVGTRCVATKDSDCKSSQECTLGGRCRAARGRCEK